MMLTFEHSNSFGDMPDGYSQAECHLYCSNVNRYTMLIDYNNNYTVHLDYMLYHMMARNYNKMIDDYTDKVVEVNNNKMACLLIGLPTDNIELMMKNENRLDNKLAVVE